MQRVNESKEEVLVDTDNGWFASISQEDVTFFTTDTGRPDGQRVNEHTMSRLSLMQVAMHKNIESSFHMRKAG